MAPGLAGLGCRRVAVRPSSPCCLSCLSPLGCILRALVTRRGRISTAAPGFHPSSPATPAEDLGWSLGGHLEGDSVDWPDPDSCANPWCHAPWRWSGQGFPKQNVVLSPVDGRRCRTATHSRRPLKPLRAGNSGFLGFVVSGPCRTRGE